MWMGESEFVEMMDMGYAEVKRRGKNDFGWRNFCHQVEWDNDGSEGHFLCDGTL